MLLKKREYNPYFFIALLNSYLLDFIFQSFNNTNHIPARELKRLPIPTIAFSNPAEKSQHDKLVALVDNMLELQKKYREARMDIDKGLYERQIKIVDAQIDRLVYDLYGLTEEVKVVGEGSRGK
jgi:hypothetical protein